MSAPRITALTGWLSSLPSAWPAAIASNELLFATPPRCSIKTRMPLLIYFLRPSDGLSDNTSFRVQLLREFSSADLSVAITQELCLLRFLRQVNLLDALMGSPGGQLRCWCDFLDLFLLRSHDAFQGRITDLAYTGLNRQQGR